MLEIGKKLRFIILQKHYHIIRIDNEPPREQEPRDP